MFNHINTIFDRLNAMEFLAKLFAVHKIERIAHCITHCLDAVVAVQCVPIKAD